MNKVIIAILISLTPTVLLAEKIQLPYNLSITQLSENAYIATDNDFYASNTLIVNMNDGTVVIVSSPFENLATTSLMEWIHKTLEPKKLIAINSHFHRDGTGGNAVYESFNVETWSSDLSKQLRLTDNKTDPIKAAEFYKDPQAKQRIIKSPAIPANNTFALEKGKTFSFSDEQVIVFFPGQAHTADNVVVYFPKQKLLFGGCMIKPKHLGYTGDANLNAWPKSARQLKQFELTTVIPGHGHWGGPELIDQTIEVAEQAIQKAKSSDSPLKDE